MFEWSKRQLAEPNVALDVVNPRTLELEVAKELLSKLSDVGANEVDAMIKRRIEYRELYGEVLSDY